MKREKRSFSFFFGFFFLKWFFFRGKRNTERENTIPFLWGGAKRQ